IVQALERLGQGSLSATPQPQQGVTYAAKLDKAEAALDFSEPAPVLARRIRAFNPVPGSTLSLPGLPDPVKVWNAVALDDVKVPEGTRAGEVVDGSPDGVDIATVQGVLRLLELQKAGGRRQPVGAFVQG